MSNSVYCAVVRDAAQLYSVAGYAVREHARHFPCSVCFSGRVRLLRGGTPDSTQPRPYSAPTPQARHSSCASTGSLQLQARAPKIVTALSQPTRNTLVPIETSRDRSRRSLRFWHDAGTHEDGSGLTGGQVVAGSNPVSPTQVRGRFRGSGTAFFLPYRLCIPPSQTERIAEALHSGPCGVVTSVTLPVTATDECPSRGSATALISTPDSSHATATEWRRVCTSGVASSTSELTCIMSMA